MLTLDSIVQVNVSVGATVMEVSTYDVGLVVVEATEKFTTAIRAKTYSSLAAVADDFAANSPAYLAAQKYFGVTPTPRMLVIGAAGDGEAVDVIMNAIREKNADWYGVYFAGATAQQATDLDAYLRGINHGMQFAAALTSWSAAAVDAIMKLDTRRTLVLHQLSTSDAHEAAAVMGEAMGCAGEYSGIAWQLCYKTINGIQPMALSQSEVEALEAKNINVYVTRGYSRNYFERGATIGGLRADEVIAIDRIGDDIRTVLLSLIAGNAAKLPQNDTTTTRFMSAIVEVLENYVDIGYIQPGIWRGADFGNVATGDTLEKGYAMYADSFDNQSDVDRALRKSMPIQVGICFSGAVESVILNVNVQQ